MYFQVEWQKGVKPDGTDSIAVQQFPSEYWPEMRILILVVNDARKKYSSTFGMKTTVETSELLKHRIEKVVPERITALKAAIFNRDFNKFAEITMKDSNTFHACNLDTFPPLAYLNDTSHAIIDMVHAYNNFKGENTVTHSCIFHSAFSICIGFRWLIRLMPDQMLVCFC